MRRFQSPNWGESERPAVTRAVPGSVSEEAAFFLGLVADFHQGRNRALRRFFGRDLRLSEARVLLLRYALAEFAEGRCATVTSAQQRLADVASPNCIRAEAALLEELGAVVLERVGIGRGGQTFTYPTEHTVRFYNSEFVGHCRRVLHGANQRHTR